MRRDTWHETWMATAITMSKRSKCVGRQVGAVIVDRTNRPVSTGYNGPPASFRVADGLLCNGFCERAMTGERTASYENCVSVHAEANALLFADRRSYEGGSIYISDPPCWDCTKLIANSGINRVVWRDADAPWRNLEKSRELLDDCGVEVITWLRNTGS